MKNYVQPGNVITIAAPAAMVSGEGRVVGDLFVVATTDMTAGEAGAFLVSGIVRLPAKTGDTFILGQKVYWDATGAVTVTAPANGEVIGHYLGVEDGLVLVRLAP